MNRYFTIILFLVGAFVNPFSSYCQSPSWAWDKTFGNSGNDMGYSIVSDPSGNVIVTGSFEDTVDFDSGPGVYDLISKGHSDVFICKYDASGNFIWGKSIGGLGYDKSRDIAIDQSGNIYLTGTFFISVDFDPGPADYTLNVIGAYDAFILKLDGSGNFIYAKQIGGPSSIAEGYSIKTDIAGNVILLCLFEGTVDFDPSPGDFDITVSDHGLALVKFDNAGNFLLAVHSETSLIFGKIALSNTGDIYVAGGFEGLADFDPGLSTFYLNSFLKKNIFLWKIDVNGNFVWAKMLGGVQDDQAMDIGVDGSGNVYFTGYFKDSVDFDPGPGTFDLYSTTENTFISKFDSSGNFVWTKYVSGQAASQGSCLEIDAFSNVFVGGSFNGTADFSPGIGANLFTSMGPWDCYISKYDTNGAFQWAIIISGSLYQDCFELSSSPSGAIDIIGNYFSPVIYFGNDSLVNLSSNSNYRDIFLASLGTGAGIGSLVDEKKFSLFPNPGKEKIKIITDISYPIIHIAIHDQAGKLVFSETYCDQKQIEIPVNNLNSGAYFITIQSKGKREVKKLIHVD